MVEVKGIVFFVALLALVCLACGVDKYAKRKRRNCILRAPHPSTRRNVENDNVFNMGRSMRDMK